MPQLSIFGTRSFDHIQLGTIMVTACYSTQNTSCSRNPSSRLDAPTTREPPFSWRSEGESFPTSRSRRCELSSRILKKLKVSSFSTCVISLLPFWQALNVKYKVYQCHRSSQFPDPHVLTPKPPLSLHPFPRSCRQLRWSGGLDSTGLQDGEGLRPPESHFDVIHFMEPQKSL